MGQPGVVANPARGQLNREIDLFRSRLSIWSREMDSAVQSRLTGPHAFGPKYVYIGHKILMKQPHDCIHSY